MDEQELQRLFEKLQSGVELTDAEMQKLAKDASLANRALSSMGSALGSLTKQATALGKKLYEGEQGASVYNDAIKSGTDAFGDLLGSLGPLGKVLGFLVKAFGGYVQEVNRLSDRLYKNYQTLSRVGVTAADGMEGLAESAQRLGLGISEAGLENFARLMQSAAQDIALMSGSAVQGRKDFVEFAETIVRGSAGRELMNLGLSVEALNEGLASYIGLQARVGMAQNKTQAQLQAGAVAYLKEMDALTKLTGLQRSEMEEGINKARAVEAFRAKVEDLRAKGQVDEAKNMELYYSILLKQAPTLAQGYAEAASGLIVSPAGRQFFQAIQSGTGVVEGLSTGAMTLEQALGATYRQAKLSEEQFRDLAMAMAAGDVVGSYTELADIAKRAGIDQEEAARIIKEVQEAQTKGPGGVAAQTDMRRAQMDSRDALQELVRVGVAPATAAMSSFAQITNKVVTALGGTVSAPPGAPMTGGGASTTGGGGGGVMGAISRFFGFGGGPPEHSWEDFIKFTGGTGDLAHFKQLDPQVQENFAKMAQEYNNLTGGKKLQINSAFRSPEEQAAVNSGNNPKAAPGKSLHNVGRAIDIQSEQAAFLAANGLLEKYGFKSGAGFNDPPHIYMRDGGIATGPKSGYAATLHGTEAVIPLPDGKTVPVVMPELTTGLRDQMQMMGAQLMALENIVAIMRDQTSISNKILQAANN